MKRPLRLSAWLALSAALVIVDQVIKVVVRNHFQEGEQLTVIAGWFDLTLWYNRGAAFSFLADHDGWQRWFFIAVAVVASLFILLLLARHWRQAMFAAGLTLILGGALGNLIDRIRLGQVVDYLLFYRGNWAFPAFNLADSAITVGAALLILDEIRRFRAQSKEKLGDHGQ